MPLRRLNCFRKSNIWSYIRPQVHRSRDWYVITTDCQGKLCIFRLIDCWLVVAGSVRWNQSQSGTAPKTSPNLALVASRLPHSSIVWMQTYLQTLGNYPASDGETIAMRARNKVFPFKIHVKDGPCCTTNTFQKGQLLLVYLGFFPHRDKYPASKFVAFFFSQ